MKVTIENIKGLNKDVKVFIDKETMNSHMDEKYEEIKGTVNLKGFRPGKVPKEILKRQFGNWFEKRKNRDKIILASKVAGPGCDWIRGGGNNFDEKKIGEAIDGSLKRLKTDYIEIGRAHV